MPKKTINEMIGQQKQRLETLNDGIFAIAMTILVLELKLPATDNVLSDSEILTYLKTVLQKIGVYLMSYLTLGLFWLGHSVQTKILTHTNKNLNWINLLFLFFVSILPFTTAFIGKFIYSKIGFWVYWLNLLFLGVSVFLHWKK